MKLIFLLSLLISNFAFSQTRATMRLFEAIDKNNLKLAERAIHDGADVNGVEDEARAMTTVLIRAAKLKRVEIVNLLLENKADPDVRRTLDLFTSLMLAAKNDDAKTAQILLKYNADVNLTSIGGRTALHVAALHNSLSVAQELIKSNEIDINKESTAKLCPLAIAARQGNDSIVTLLKAQTGSKAVSPECLEKAIHLAELNKNDGTLLILKGE